MFFFYFLSSIYSFNFYISNLIFFSFSFFLLVDEIPLSRPKRSITRDFSDGVLMAEVVHHYFPKLVESKFNRIKYIILHYKKSIYMLLDSSDYNY